MAASGDGLAGAFLSVFDAPDKFFSIFNWCFLPLAYAFLYVLVSTYLAEKKEKKKALFVQFAALTFFAVGG